MEVENICKYIMENRARPRRTHNYLTDSVLDRKLYYSNGFAHSLIQSLRNINVKGGGNKKYAKEPTYNHISISILNSFFNKHLASLLGRILCEYGIDGLNSILEFNEAKFNDKELKLYVGSYLDNLITQSDTTDQTDQTEQKNQSDRSDPTIIMFKPFVSNKKNIIYIGTDINQSNEDLLVTLGLNVVPQKKRDTIETLQLQNYTIDKIINGPWWYLIKASK